MAQPRRARAPALGTPSSPEAAAAAVAAAAAAAAAAAGGNSLSTSPSPRAGVCPLPRRSQALVPTLAGWLVFARHRKGGRSSLGVFDPLLRVAWHLLSATSQESPLRDSLGISGHDQEERVRALSRCPAPAQPCAVPRSLSLRLPLASLSLSPFARFSFCLLPCSCCPLTGARRRFKPRLTPSVCVGPHLALAYYLGSLSVCTHSGDWSLLV